MLKILVTCPCCGTELTEKDLYGLYLRCPSCRNEYIYKNGTAKETCFYVPSTGSYNEFLKKFFKPLLPYLQQDFFDKVNILLRESTLIPFVDVVDKEGNNKMIPAVRQVENWEEIDFPLIKSSGIKKKQGLDRQDEIKSYTEYKKSVTDFKFIQELSDTYSYVSSELYYIPIKILKFEYNGDIFRITDYNGAPTSRGTSLEKLQQNKKDKIYEIPRWTSFLFNILVCILWIASWFAFCHTYWRTHEIMDLIVWADAYKCWGKFLGAVILSPFVVALMKRNFEKYRSTYIDIKNEKAFLKKIEYLKQTGYKVLHTQL